MNDEYKILKFMGCKLVKDPKLQMYRWETPTDSWLKDKLHGRLVIVAKAPFSTDWNWLHAVVEKIESLKNNSEISNDHCIFSGVICKEIHSCIKKKGEEKISMCYRAVIKFIDNYNKTKK